jgi:cell division protein FtsB
MLLLRLRVILAPLLVCPVARFSSTTLSFFFFFFFFSTDKSEDVSLLRGEIEALKAEKQQANKKIEELERTVAELRKQLPAAKSD